MLKTFINFYKSNKVLVTLFLLFGLILGCREVYKFNTRINNIFTVREESITYDNLPPSFSNYKILHLSDLHSKEFGKNNSQLINTIKKISPDIIMVTGDMFTVTDIDYYSNEKELISYKLLCELAKNYKVIYVTGNHEEGKDLVYNGEIYSERNRDIDNSVNRYLKGIIDAGVIFLGNDKYTLTKNNESINLFGLNFYSYEDKDEFYNNLEGDINNFDILLSHNPLVLDDLSEKNFELILSGHVHGGVIRLPLFGGILDPERKLFPPYDKGIYKKNNTYMNVSSGLGDSSIPRFNNIPEITLITLNKK